MYFEHTYRHNVSYYSLFFIYVVCAVAMWITFSDPYAYLFISIAIAFAAVMTYHHYSNTNKLVVGMNAEGLCIWQKRDYYLFCPWESLEHVCVRQQWRPYNQQQNNNYGSSGQWVKYVDISYRTGAVWYVDKSTTYVKDNVDTHVRIRSEKSSTDQYQFLYESNLPYTAQSMVTIINTMKDFYLKNRGYGSTDVHEVCKCIKQVYEVD